MASSLTRVSQTMNTMISKPVIRKSFHTKNSPTGTAKKMEMEEPMKKKQHMEGNDDNALTWVPHEKTGIYYPKGQEKIMEDVPHHAGRDVGVNWFSIKH
ncbi:hypothetical protein QN277_016536 [Acacia crassicarpa]|uniref:Late embryogenesis abundant protein n=1 Tax=Acacia crassicarpa TaxID=499986 RepID=A0AAE1MWW4_9FABA|nr:hypothetical protein QN277_016536 [Acacia crassicarpa]